MQARKFTLIGFAVAVLVLAPGVPAQASSGPGGFSSEQPAGTPYKQQGNWEPAVATDPNHPGLVYQLITGINAHQCAPGCPGTSVLFRKSADGGITWGAEQFVCGLACKGVGWQFDPQIKVADDTNQSCACGTIYAAFLNTFDPGVVLFKSHDGGNSWQGPITMNGPLRYMDKPALNPWRRGARRHRRVPVLRVRQPVLRCPHAGNVSQTSLGRAPYVHRGDSKSGIKAVTTRCSPLSNPVTAMSRHGKECTMRSDTQNVTIAATPEQVFAFVADGANLPRWAIGFAKSVRNAPSGWIVGTAQGGEVPTTIAADSATGTIDFRMKPAPGMTATAYTRVLPNAGGAEFVFTQFQQPGVPDEVFGKLVASVGHEMAALKALMEVECPL